MAEASSPVSTFLLTDMEGSTRLWEVAPDDMPTLLARHDDLLRTTTIEHGGDVVKTTGDGLFARFAEPTAAVRCAVAIQRAIFDEPWAVGPVRVRVGVHVGPATPRDDDWYGRTVNRVARLHAVAHGGQVVVSDDIARVVEEPGVTFRDLGRHRLRDVGEPMTIHQVVAAGLPEDHPPLRTEHLTPRGLPTPGRSLVGRTDERLRIGAAVRTHRVVTVTGGPGVGKTRLAVEVARAVAAEFPGGVWCSELEALPPSTPAAGPAAAGGAAAPAGTAAPGAAVAATLARLLGSAAGDQADGTEAVVQALGPTRSLVVLDGCEHVRDDAAAVVAAVVAHCPDTVVLATSRRRLGVDVEHVIDLEPLSAADAVELFRTRAADAGAVEVDPAACTGLVDRLDRLPLPIELAAARARTHHPDEIAESLERRAPDWLHGAVAWSYELLEPAEQRALCATAVFGGAFTVDRAVRLLPEPDARGDDARPDDRRDRLDTLLGNLVDRSLLRVDARQRPTTFRHFEIVRRYARERLDEDDAGATLATSFDRAVVAEAIEAGRRLSGPDERRWVDAIGVAFDDLRAAHGRLLARGDVTAAGELVAALIQHATMRSTEVGTWARRVADTPEAWETGPIVLVAAIAAEEAMRRNDTETAIALAERAVEVADDAPAGSRRRRDAWMARSTLALSTFLSGRVGHGMRRMGELRDRIDEIGDDPFAHAVSAYAEATVLTYGGEPDLATEAVRRLRATADAARSPSIRAMAGFCEGNMLLVNSPGRAERALTVALELAQSVDNVRMTNQSRWALADLAAKGDPVTALDRLAEVLDDVGREPDNAQQVLVRCLGPLVAIGDDRTAAAIAFALEETVWNRSAAYVTARSHLDHRLSDDVRRSARSVADGGVDAVTDHVRAAIEALLATTGVD